MPDPRPVTIPEYIDAAPEHAREHLQKLYALLKKLVPSALEPFRGELSGYTAGTATLQLPYDKPVPAALVRKIAKYRVRDVRENDARWM